MSKTFYKLTAILPIFLIGLSILMSTSVSAATPTGSLSCAASSSSSITVGLSYADTGSSPVNLYRYGAPGNGQIASYPGPSGSGRHTDTGLSGAYRYQLRTGTTVLANVECVTKPVAAPAPATPVPAPTPPAPQPVVPTPAPAPAPTPTAAVPPAATTPTVSEPSILPSEGAFSVEELPPAESEQTDEDPIVALPATKENRDSGAGWIAAPAIVTLLIFAGLYMLLRKRQRMQTTVNTSRGDLDAIAVPSILPTPIQNPSVAPMPTSPVANPSAQTMRFDRSIDKAFYPSRSAAATTLADNKAHEIPDMYTVANQHPESYGNMNYSPIIKAQPPAGPSLDKTLNIQHRQIVSDQPGTLKISH